MSDEVRDVIGGGLIAAAVTWIGKRVLGGPDTAKADTEKLRVALAEEHAKLDARVHRLEEKISVLIQQVNGAGFGLTTVVSKLTEVVERLDKTVTHMDARMEAQDHGTRP